VPRNIFNVLPFQCVRLVPLQREGDT
jgi:hypothetical protein